jgi:tetraacyldisaccharide 4'-kinase
MIKKIEIYIKQVICGQRKGLTVYLVKAALRPLSWGYRLLMLCRNFLYDRGWMRRYIPPVPLVISVGNIVAGGTGKTPVTLLLARAFYERFELSILSRGYRSKVEKLEMPILLCEREGPIFPASYCGDEPYLFAQRFPKAIVIVGGDRKKASFLAAKAGAQVILLDDGMQHRRLARDFDIVVVDVRDPFGQGYFLPRGFLREDRHSLARAHLIILNHVTDQEQFLAAKTQLSPYTSVPMVGVRGEVIAIQDLKGQVCDIKDQLIGMFCAIAHPDYFKNTLEQEGGIVVDEYILADHDEIKERNLAHFALICLKKGAKYLVCTEKDRVKLSDQLTIALPVLWVQQELRVTVGQEEWQAFLQQAEAKIV